MRDQIRIMKKENEIEMINTKSAQAEELRRM